MRDLPQAIDYTKEQLAYALANAIKERDEAREFAEQWYFLHDQEVRSNIEIEKKLDEAMNVLKTIASWQGGLGAKWPMEIARDFLEKSK